MKIGDLIARERDEYVSIVMSRELLRFCRDNDLPFESADELALRDNQIGRAHV